MLFVQVIRNSVCLPSCLFDQFLSSNVRTFGSLFTPTGEFNTHVSAQLRHWGFVQQWMGKWFSLALCWLFEMTKLYSSVTSNNIFFVCVCQPCWLPHSWGPKMEATSWVSLSRIPWARLPLIHKTVCTWQVSGKSGSSTLVKQLSKTGYLACFIHIYGSF